MSRIFDALQRSERANAGKTARWPPAGGQEPQNSLTSWESCPPNFERVERVICQPLGDEQILAISQNHGADQEKFRVLGYRLQKARQRQHLSRVLVASAIPKEGKTVVALNLAAILARSSPRVLLVDADMRHAGIPRALGLGSLPGLADFLEGRIELAAAYRRVDPLGFYYLPAGYPSTNPVELLQRPELEEVMSQTMAAFDWIVFDSAPLSLFADAHHLATLADAVLLVIREGVTPRWAAEQTMAALEGAFIVGVVLNGCTDSHGERYDHLLAPLADVEDHTSFSSPPEPRAEKATR